MSWHEPDDEVGTQRDPDMQDAPSPAPLPRRSAVDDASYAPFEGSAGEDLTSVPLVSIEVPETGDPGLDEMLRALAQSATLNPEEQLPVIEAVHRSLQDRLADAEG